MLSGRADNALTDAARLGIEPRYAASKAAVLPLDDLAMGGYKNHMELHYQN